MSPLRDSPKTLEQFEYQCRFRSIIENVTIRVLSTLKGCWILQVGICIIFHSAITFSLFKFLQKVLIEVPVVDWTYLTLELLLEYEMTIMKTYNSMINQDWSLVQQFFLEKTRRRQVKKCDLGNGQQLLKCPVFTIHYPETQAQILAVTSIISIDCLCVFLGDQQYERNQITGTQDKAIILADTAKLARKSRVAQSDSPCQLELMSAGSCKKWFQQQR